MKLLLAFRIIISKLNQIKRHLTNINLYINVYSKDELQIEYGQNENLQTSVFSNKNKTVFYVGRKADCDIVLHDSEVSREQAIIYYENGNWFIKDGGKETSSLNGTWLYIEKKYAISGNFVFKVGPSKMKIEFIEEQK
jgi:pSer/pThr/pTyr-binding forkhead associated (FHA) protein